MSENSYALRIVSAPNALTNPSFEDGLQSWQAADQNLVDWIVDYDFRPPGDTGLGAAVLFAGGQISQCVAVYPDTEYRVSVSAFGGCADDPTVLRLEWYAGDSCSVLSGTDAIMVSTKSGEWQTTGRLAQSNDAQSARFILAQDDTCKEAVVLDNAELTDQIFAATFE
jgi:hypothetical protein